MKTHHNLLSSFCKGKRTIYLILFILLFIFSCNRKKENIDSKTLSFNYNTGFFYSPEKMQNYYFQKGWKKLKNKENYLLFEKEGLIRFQIYNKQNLEFRFSIEKGKRLKGEPIIELLLNKNIVRKISIEDNFIPYRIKFPRELLKTGDNYIIFRISKKSISKSDYHGGLKYNPNAYLKLKNCCLIGEKGKVFMDQVAILKNGHRFQRPNSRIFYYFNGRDTKEIIIKTLYKYKTKKRLLLNIFYESEKGEKGFIKKIIITKKNNTIKLNLTKFKKNIIYKLIFDLKGNYNDGYIIWEKINLILNEKQKIQKRDDNVSLKFKPNIYYILLDALRYDVIGKKENGMELTHSINSFSKHSYVFKNFYTQAPYTRASVATLFTGLLPETHGLRNIDNLFPSSLPNLIKTLKDNGYNTTTIYGTEVLDTNDLIKDFNNRIYIRVNIPKQNDTSLMNNKILLYSLKHIKTAKPKFVYIHLLPPHEPYNPGPSFRNLFINTSNYYQNGFVEIVNKANYFGNISSEFLNYLHLGYYNNVVYADFLVKRILRVIKVLGEYDSSIIIITADHGEAFFEHGKIGHNSTNYQEMIHIPFIIKLPKQKIKKICYAKKGIVDIFPTIMQLLNIKYDNLFLQGESFANCFNNQNIKDDAFIYSRTDSMNINNAVIWKNY
jgi:hypothetical protein